MALGIMPMQTAVSLLFIAAILIACAEDSEDSLRAKAREVLDSYSSLDVHKWREGNEICIQRLSIEELAELNGSNSIPIKPPLEELLCGVGVIIDAEVMKSGDVRLELWKAGVTYAISEPNDIPGVIPEYWVYWAPGNEQQRQVGIEILQRYVPEYPLPIRNSTVYK